MQRGAAKCPSSWPHLLVISRSRAWSRYGFVDGGGLVPLLCTARSSWPLHVIVRSRAWSRCGFEDGGGLVRLLCTARSSWYHLLVIYRSMAWSCCSIEDESRRVRLVCTACSSVHFFLGHGRASCLLGSVGEGILRGHPFLWLAWRLDCLGLLRRFFPGLLHDWNSSRCRGFGLIVLPSPHGHLFVYFFIRQAR